VNLLTFNSCVVVTIVGVADRGFTRLTPEKSADLYVPLTQEESSGAGVERQGSGRRIGVTLLMGVAFGLAPALRGARTAAAVKFSRGTTNGARA
jgi:hypothetical protein